ncbi:hypothetical protein BaRGS_00014574 [Batillaria attramentaria]|uniref:Uncharacterized protein n=1 Tax=Batillaria attramentaria TaxID=370345 RepID=A0ABD0L484_9CAEN
MTMDHQRYYITGYGLLQVDFAVYRQKTSEPDEDEVHNPDVGLLPMLQHLAPFGFPGADGFHGQGEVNENEGAVGVLSTLGPGLSGAKDTVSRPYEYIPFAKTHQDETDVHQHYKIHRDRRAAGDTGPTPTVTPTPLWVVYPSYAGWLWSQILRSGAWPQQRSSPLAASRVQQNPLPHADGRVWSQPSLQDQGAQSRRKGVPLADGDVSGSVNTNSFFAGLSAVERLVLQNAVPAVGAPFLDGTWQTRNQPRRNTGQTEQTGRNLRQHPQKAWNSGQNGQTGRNFGQQGQTGRNEENQGQSGRILGQQEQMGRILGNQGQSGRILGQQEQMGRILGQRGQTGRNAQNQGQTGRILRQQGQTGRNTGNLGQAGRNFGQGQTGPNFGQARPNVRQQGQTNGLSQPQPANGSGRGGQAVRAPLTAAAWVIPVYPGQGVWIRAGK